MSPKRRSSTRRPKASRGQAKSTYRRRRRSWSGFALVVGLGAIALFAIGSALSAGTPGATASPSPPPSFGVASSAPPTLATATTPPSAAPGSPPPPSASSVVASQSAAAAIDGIPCESLQSDYSARAHLSIVVDGKAEAVPDGIGVRDGCMYWIHTSSTGGLVSIEAPSKQALTLGQLFDIWGQPVSAGQIGPYAGTSGDQLNAFVDGKVWTGDPRQIPLADGSVIELQLGSAAVSPAPYSFPPAP